MTTLPERPEVAAVRSTGRTNVLIIGGGINGIATFRDLALQGVDVVLVDRGDFASGATAASSHMIHGGIRYLENGELRLVRESVQERNRLLRTAPHFVRPLRTTIPIYSTFRGLLSAPMRMLRHRPGKHTERGALLIKVGLMIYDTFSRDGGRVPRHRFQGRRASLQELPQLDPTVRYTATYFDASVHDPERLALDVLRDGAQAHAGARALNYVEVVGSAPGGARLRDAETQKEFTLAADVVVNASGPWADLTNGALGNSSQFMGGTKGSHIVLDHPELHAATGDREIFFEHSDGRIVLIYPLKGRVLVGTTDIDADPREPAVCTDAEVDYFFALIKHVFPTIEVSRQQIVYRYAGIRPLPRHDDVAPGLVSRDYRIEVDTSMPQRPVLTLVGGKWTTFRALGESLADAVLELLDRPRKVRTVGLAIGGGRGYPTTAQESRELRRLRPALFTDPRQRVLFERYGMRIDDVTAFLAEEADEPLANGALSTRELAWMVEREHVVHLTDVLLRRTSLAFTGDADVETVEQIARALATLLGWDDARQQLEIASCLPALGRETAGPSAPAYR